VTFQRPGRIAMIWPPMLRSGMSTVGLWGPRRCHWPRSGCNDRLQAFKARDTLRAAFLVRAHISFAQEMSLARFPNELAVR
jgi:hypothetical protein